MSVPLTGDVTSRQIAGCLEGNPNSGFSLASSNSRFVTGKASGDIAFSDWRGKAWRQGAGSPLPVGLDERLDGYLDPPPESYGRGATDEWTARGYWSLFPNGEYKGVAQTNSYFYTEIPAGDALKKLKLTGRYSVNIYDRFSREFPPYGHLYVFAYTSGYLSGSRQTLYMVQLPAGSTSRSIDATLNVPAGYPYVVINMGAWADGKNTSVQGQEIRVTMSATDLKIGAIQ